MIRIFRTKLANFSSCPRNPSPNTMAGTRMSTDRYTEWCGSKHQIRVGRDTQGSSSQTPGPAQGAPRIPQKEGGMSTVSIIPHTLLWAGGWVFQDEAAGEQKAALWLLAGTPPMLGGCG